MLNVIYFELVLYFFVCDCLLLIGTNVLLRLCIFGLYGAIQVLLLLLSLFIIELE